MINDRLAAIVSGEDSTHQFKVDVRNGDSPASEMVAFANSDGGTIFIGIADDGSVPRAFAKGCGVNAPGLPEIPEQVKAFRNTWRGRTLTAQNN